MRSRKNSRKTEQLNDLESERDRLEEGIPLREGITVRSLHG